MTREKEIEMPKPKECGNYASTFPKVNHTIKRYLYIRMLHKSHKGIKLVRLVLRTKYHVFLYIITCRCVTFKLHQSLQIFIKLPFFQRIYSYLISCFQMSCVIFVLFQSHMMRKHGVDETGNAVQKTLQCPHCDFSCYFKHEFNFHVKKHNPDKPFKCKVFL